MVILLGSANSSVLSRWHDLLAGHHSLILASSLSDVKNQAAALQVDMVIMHRVLVDADACAEIRSLSPAVKLFLLSDNPTPEEGLAFLKAGIVGYGNTYISPERLIEAVNIIGAGGVWLGQKVIQQLILETSKSSGAPDSPDLEQRLSMLTRMELKVARLVARGRTNLEIADELEIAERTVKAHLTAIYDKMHVANRLSLALLINQGRA
mgnify:CR=1 FL=1